jgi:hypothetical protein
MSITKSEPEPSIATNDNTTNIVKGRELTMADSNDTWELVKSGLSLLANIFDAVEKRNAGQPYSASAMRAGSDLASIANTISKRSSSEKQSTAVAAPVSSPTYGGFRLTSRWVHPTSSDIGVAYDQETGLIVFISPRDSGNGYNFYYGAAIQNGASFHALASGRNSVGERIVMRAVFTGNAMSLAIWDFDTEEASESLHSRG